MSFCKHSICIVIAILFLISGLKPRAFAQEKVVKFQSELDHLFQEIDSLFYNEPTKAAVLADKAITLAHNNNSPNDESYAYHTKGSLLSMQGNYGLALEDFNIGLDIAKEHNLPRRIVQFNLEIGKIKTEWGDFPGALQDMQSALNLSRESQDTNLQIAALNSIALLHIDRKTPRQALVYLNENLDLVTLTGDEHGQAIAYNNLGNLHYEMNQYEKALTFYNTSLDIVSAKNLSYGIKENLSDIGKAHEYLGNWEYALDHYKQALAISNELKLTNGIIQELLHISGIHLHNKNYETAISLSREALSLMDDKTNLKQKVSAYKTLSEGLAENGEFYQAYQNRIKYDLFQDSLFNQENAKYSNELEMRFQNEKKEAENVQLKLQQVENELVIKQKNILSLIITGGLLLTIGLLLFFYRQYEQKEDSNKKLEEQVLERTFHLETAVKELERFTYIASHDLKEPIRNISSFVSLIERNIKNDKQEENLDYIDHVKNNTKQLYQLLEDILNYSQIKTHIQEYRQTDIKVMVEQFKTENTILIDQRNVQILTSNLSNVDLPAPIYFVIKNLVSNAIKYNDQKIPMVNISSIKSDNKIILTIADNGIGIKPEYHHKIFDMFVRLHHRGEFSGSGLGLSICKKVIEHFKGKIELKSDVGEGSVFTIILPIEHLKNNTQLFGEYDSKTLS